MWARQSTRTATRPDILQAYVNAFNNSAIGVTGNEKQVADLARRYRVAYQIESRVLGDDADINEVTIAP